MDEFEKELKEGFLEESDALLEDAEQALLDLESQDNPEDVLNRLFRAAHNIKGTSRAVGFGELAEFTHVMENLILKVKEGEITITPTVVTVLLESFDHIGVMVSTLKTDLDATFESSSVVTKIESVINGEASDKTDTEAIEKISEGDFSEEIETDAFDLTNIEDTNFEELEDESNENSLKENNSFTLSQPVPPPSLDIEKLALAEAADDDPHLLDNDPSVDQLLATASLEALKIADTEEQKLAKETDAFDAMVQELQSESENNVTSLNTEKPEESKIATIDSPVPKQNNKSNQPIDESIRVKISRLETLNNFVGELVILQSVLVQHKDEIKSPLLQKTIGQLNKLSKEIHEISMSLRMIPIKPTLQKMQRIVRDTSRSLSKKVDLKLIGMETEVDKTVLEHLNDPLTHIIRNAVDHGLETTEERLALKKSEHGNISVACFHEGNSLVIEIKDDGKGINPVVIRKKAIEKGVIKASSNLNEVELINLIFHPGFSTKAEVSEVSGRGVGMDVVKTNIESLKGEVSVSSFVGKGSLFRITLPLTMAVIDGMITRVGKEKYVVPLSQIQETLRPNKEDISHVTGVGDILNLRGENLPIFQVDKNLKRQREPDDRPELVDQIAIIVKTAQASFALVVDEIFHQQQIVVKSLSKEITKQKGFMGSSILGDGLPAFILDLHDMIEINNTNNMKQKIRRAA